MILRDLPEYKQQRLFNPEAKGYTYWQGYGIEYVPRQYFRVCRLTEGEKPQPIKGTARTIDETGGFFQASFVKTLIDWQSEIDLDNSTLDAIREGKQRRESFVQMNKAEREYCRLECELLAKVMERLRAHCIASDIVPNNWRGAGQIASRLHFLNKTPKRPGEHRLPELNEAADRAYYGGRFEVTRIGKINLPIYGYDINSAYPAAMLNLPCPIHTEWKHVKRQPQDGLWLGDITFDHREGPLYGLPMREKSRLKWPQRGRGCYWSVEIEAASCLGCKVIHFHSGWQATRRCDCKPYQWINDLYLLRKRLDTGGKGKGYPIKLGINASYGKLAQRIGAATYHDNIAAGIITATTRAMLNRAIAQAPSEIVMLATDAVYSLTLLRLPLSRDLGDWEEKKYPHGIFIVQPGVYWNNGVRMRHRQKDLAPKTRGMPLARLMEHTTEFENAWNYFLSVTASAPCTDWCFVGGPPRVSVPIPSFIGLRAGLHRRDPFAAGKWSRVAKEITFEWKHKRRFDDWRIVGSHIVTLPYVGRFSDISEPIKKRSSDTAEERRLLDEAMPDYVSWLPGETDRALDE